MLYVLHDLVQCSICEIMHCKYSQLYLYYRYCTALVHSAVCVILTAVVDSMGPKLTVDCIVSRVPLLIHVQWRCAFGCDF